MGRAPWTGEPPVTTCEECGAERSYPSEPHNAGCSERPRRVNENSRALDIGTGLIWDPDAAVNWVVSL